MQKLVFLVAVAVALGGCSRPQGGPSDTTTPHVPPPPPPSVVPAVPEGSPTPPSATPDVPTAAPAPEALPLSSYTAPVERYLQAAYRALEQAREALLRHSYSYLVEDTEVAIAALQAARAAGPDARQLAAIDAVLAQLQNGFPAYREDMDAVLAPLAEVLAAPVGLPPIGESILPSAPPTPPTT